MFEQVPPPPPPPLPPPAMTSPSPPPVERKLLLTPKYVTMCSTACTSEIDKIPSLLLIHHLKNYFSSCKKSVKLLSHINSTFSILQTGPTCGVVALSMASQLLNFVDVDPLMEKALDMNITKHGEMFSVYGMADLAIESLKCDAQVLTNLETHKKVFIEHLLRGQPMLIPYDADKNHEPCCKNGNKAHWALVSGFCLTFDDVDPGTALEHSSFIGDDFRRTEEQPLKEEDVCKIMEELKDIKRLYLYCRHGKSRRLTAFEINDLLRSNSNLYEYDGDDLKVYAGADLSDLRDKIILLKRSEKY